MLHGSKDFPRIRVGISACLLGQKVRFDGGHKHNRLVTDRLSALFDYHPVCPESAGGLGTPREPIRLVEMDGSLHLRTSRDHSVDVTQQVKRASARLLDSLPDDLCGFILKKDSPSCGLERVKSYNNEGHLVARENSGLFASALQQALPLLPLEEEGRLNDPALRENFIIRTLLYHHLRQIERYGITLKALQQFHRHHKFLLKAYSADDTRHLGRMLADCNTLHPEALFDHYFASVMQLSSKPIKRNQHAMTLSRMTGYLKHDISKDDRQELEALITAYRQGETSLATPLALLRHHCRSLPNNYVSGQSYLCPHPDTLGLRIAL